MNNFFVVDIQDTYYHHQIIYFVHNLLRSIIFNIILLEFVGNQSRGLLEAVHSGQGS